MNHFQNLIPHNFHFYKCHISHKKFINPKRYVLCRLCILEGVKIYNIRSQCLNDTGSAKAQLLKIL